VEDLGRARERATPRYRRMSLQPGVMYVSRVRLCLHEPVKLTRNMVRVVALDSHP